MGVSRDSGVMWGWLEGRGLVVSLGWGCSGC